MNILLSWDLFVTVFFIVIVAYSFIVGRDNTLKVILGTYVSMIAADATGNLFGKYFGSSEMFMKILRLADVTTDSEAVVFVKVVIFVILVILFAILGAFQVRTVDDRSVIVRIGLSVIYAVMSAGLIISVILVFVSGLSIIGGGNIETLETALFGIYNRSTIIRNIITHANLWFALPALAFLLHSYYSSDVDE